MDALVVYDSQYDNTERVALTVADELRAFERARLAHNSRSRGD
jgi:flavodoxin